MLFFYWPSEDAQADSEETAEQAERSMLMSEILSAEAVRAASTFFHCYKCNVKELDAKLKEKYRIRYAPKVLFFDVNGKKTWWLTNIKASPNGVAKKMAQIAFQSNKLLEEAKK